MAFDYELFAPDDATMQTALTSLNMRVHSGKVGTTVFAVNYYGTKYAQNGTTTVTNPMGQQVAVPNMVAQPGVYAAIRWMGASALTLAANVISLGCTLTLVSGTPYRAWE